MHWLQVISQKQLDNLIDWDRIKLFLGLESFFIIIVNAVIVCVSLFRLFLYEKKYTDHFKSLFCVLSLS